MKWPWSKQKTTYTSMLETELKHARESVNHMARSWQGLQQQYDQLRLAYSDLCASRIDYVVQIAQWLQRVQPDLMRHGIELPPDPPTPSTNEQEPEKAA